MRLLHQRNDHAGGRIPRPEQEPDGRSGSASARAEPLQVRHPRPDPSRRHARCQANELKREPPMLDAQLSRRAFLKTGGALVVTFTLAPQVGRAQAARWPLKSVAADEVATYLAIDGNGMVTLYSGKVELGTGAFTALTQIAAEELSVPLDRVTTIQGDTALTPDQGPTYASLSIQVGGMQIRRAAATARETL